MIKINDKIIGGNRTFIIAEIGSNHNQNIEQAYRMMDIAKECGADAVKFQSIKGEKIYRYSEISPEQKDLLEKIQLKEEWYKKIFDYAKKIGMICLSAPTYLEAVDLLAEHHSMAVKIASPQTYGFPQIIEKVNEMNVPIIMSTGYCLYKEIERAVSLVKNKEQLILLHCTASYPTAPEQVNLNFIETLKNMFGVTVGFSDHTLGYHITLAAVAKGAKVIEKHITISRDEEGPDHFFALEPQEFKAMVQGIREIEVALGTGQKNELTKYEIQNRGALEARLYFGRDMKKGEIVAKEDITFFRGKMTEVSAWELETVIGKCLLEDVDKDTSVDMKKLS